tara:strand:- start:1309 stop:1671 length:363 start_codon:yes stop_codon:yes gene_type:complete
MAKKVNDVSNMPQMGSAFSGWQSNITLNKVTQTNVRGDITNVLTAITFKGTVQPLSPEQILLKPEGERSWRWLQIHVFAGGDNLKTGDRISYKESFYKVMADLDYSNNNFVEYHLVEDFQ